MRRLVVLFFLVILFSCVNAQMRPKIGIKIKDSAPNLDLSIKRNIFDESKASPAAFDQYLQESLRQKSTEDAQESIDQISKEVAQDIDQANAHIPLNIKAKVFDPVLENDALKFVKDRLSGPTKFDSRIELRYLNPIIEWQRQILLNSAGVGLIIKKSEMQQVTDSVYKIKTSVSLKQKYNLCPEEAFGSQPVAGEGTAFLINNSEIMTASHVFTEPIENYFIVFGFELINKVGAYQSFIESKNIYRLQNISYRDGRLDIAVASLDRIADRKPLKTSSAFNYSKGKVIYMLGHPSGLPQKAAVNASIQTVTPGTYFYTSLDAFQGNSGSPVFDLKTNEVIGILVSGELDFKWNGSCNVSAVCRIPYCNGEKVIKMTDVLRARRGEY